MFKGLIRRAVLAVAALAAPVALIAAPATVASASSATLTISAGSYSTWAAAGSGYSWGETTVQIWVMDVTNGGWSVLEYQNNLTTTSSYCSKLYCQLGGRFSAKGAVTWFPGGGLFPAGYYANHTLSCGHQYEPVTYGANDGWVYGNVLTMPACPILH
jgi:hypothetical protein